MAINITEINNILWKIEPFIEDLKNDKTLDISKSLFDEISILSTEIARIDAYLIWSGGWYLWIGKKLVGIKIFWFSLWNNNKDLKSIKKDIENAFNHYKKSYEYLSEFLVTLNAYTEKLNSYEKTLKTYKSEIESALLQNISNDEKIAIQRTYLTINSLSENIKLANIRISNILKSSQYTFEIMKKTFNIFESTMNISISMESSKNTKKVVWQWIDWFGDSLSSLGIGVEDNKSDNKEKTDTIVLVSNWLKNIQNELTKIK